MLSETGCLPGFLFYSFRCGNWEWGIGHWEQTWGQGEGKDLLQVLTFVPKSPCLPCSLACSPVPSP